MYRKYNSWLVYDPSCSDIDCSVFKKYEWTEFYWDTKAEIPINAPESRGREVDIQMIADSTRAGDKKSCG